MDNSKKIPREKSNVSQELSTLQHQIVIAINRKLILGRDREFSPVKLCGLCAPVVKYTRITPKGNTIHRFPSSAMNPQF